MRIRDLVTLFKERDPPSNTVVFSVSEKLGIVPQDRLFTKKIALDNRTAYLKIEWGDVVYNPYLLWNRAVGVCFDKCGGCVSPAYVVLRPRVQGIERFLHYFFRSKVFTVAVDAIASGSVTRRRTAPVEEILDLEFDIPSLPEQKAINIILTSIDSKVELNQRKNETLEAIAQALFQSWFVSFEPFQSKGMRDSPLGEIPMGWEVGKISDIAILNRESINPSYYPNEVFKHYSIAACDEGHIPKAETGDQIRSNKFRVHAEAVLISKLNPRFPRIWIPFDSGSGRPVCSTEFLVVTPQKNIRREYLYALFSSNSFQATFSTLLTGTSSSHQRVRPEDFMTIDAVIPPADVTTSFSDIVSPLFTSENCNLVQNDTLSAIRDMLLPRLLSGDIRVKDAEKLLREAL